jgi:hypothetical protein
MEEKGSCVECGVLVGISSISSIERVYGFNSTSSSNCCPTSIGLSQLDMKWSTIQ